MDLAKVVSATKRYDWARGAYDLDATAFNTPDAKFHVVAYDFGVKRNILRRLVARGCKVTVVPAEMPAEEALGLGPDGILLANGPGDDQAGLAHDAELGW